MDEQRRSALQERLLQKLRQDGKLPPAPVSEDEVQKFFDENKATLHGVVTYPHSAKHLALFHKFGYRPKSLTAIITLTAVDWGPDNWRLPLWFTALVVLVHGTVRHILGKPIAGAIVDTWQADGSGTYPIQQQGNEVVSNAAYPSVLMIDDTKSAVRRYHQICRMKIPVAEDRGPAFQLGG